MRTLHPQLATWLTKINAAAPTPLTAQAARDGLATLTANFVTQVPFVALIKDATIRSAHHDIPVRIYSPAPDRALPVHVYLHGGGHMAGSVSVYDPICRKMALATACVVVSVDYRLTPEHPYPAGLSDAMEAVKGTLNMLAQEGVAHKNSLSVAGDSGGGALAATLAALSQKDPDLAIERQILIYPSLDYTMQHPSLEKNGKGLLLEKEKIAWYFDAYFQGHEDRKAASPLFMDIGASLPETYIATAEFCPLRDEGLAYAEKLRQAGVRVQHIHFDDMIHAFANIENLVPEACRRLYESAGMFMQG